VARRAELLRRLAAFDPTRYARAQDARRVRTRLAQLVRRLDREIENLDAGRPPGWRPDLPPPPRGR
jgi:hypothetical protein